MVNITELLEELNATVTYNVTIFPFNVTTFNDTSTNATVLNITEDPGSVDNVTERVPAVTQVCVDAANTSTAKTHHATSHDALLYIVVVLLFYAFSMVILMVKYIRREREEAEMAHYYSEFVSRERFKTPMFEIRNCMQGLKIKSAKFTSPSTPELDDDEYVSCPETPLVIKDQKLYIGEETKI